MAEFVEAARLEQVPAGTGTTATVDGKELALFNMAGTVYAIDDGCLHQGASLGAGKLEGRVVTCRVHGWKYDVSTGSTTHVPGYGVGCYPVRIIDGKILVALG